MKNVLIKITSSIILSLTLLITGCGQPKPSLNVYTWSDYVDISLIQEFEKANNCKVVIDTFDSNESMYSKIKAGAVGYDIIIPTSYMAKLMYEQKLIEKLDLEKIPNSKFIDKRYLNNLAFDKKMEYSIPYMLGYTCIAYNKEKLGKLDNSWDVFSKEELKGRMTMLDDYRETLGAGLFFIGAKINSINPTEIEKAKDQVLKWKKNLAKFDNEVYKNGITSGEFIIVQGYSGDLLQVMEESKNIECMIPKEGVSISCDDIVIPVSAPNKELAYKFINFIIEPHNAAKNMAYTQFFPPVPEAKQYAEGVDVNRIFPEVLYETGQIIQDLGNNNILYQDAWNKVKSSK